MAIEFTNSGAQRISYGVLPVVANLSQKSICSWVYKDANTNGFLVRQVPDSGTDELWNVSLDGATGKFAWVVGWSGGSAQWVLDNAPSTSAWHRLVWTYDNGSTANNPLAYVDGNNVAITESIAPSGTYRSGTGTNFIISGEGLDGKQASLLVYNRILSALDVLDDYNSSLAIPSHNGLVFAPNLVGAATAQIFDGTTLTSSHKIVDQVSGAIGTPAGSPVGRADDLLTYE